VDEIAATGQPHGRRGAGGREPQVLLSLDIDGTLETGDPSGPVTIEVVKLAKARGLVVGSASDRTISHQRRMWEEAGVVVDFVGHKHHLAHLVQPFGCHRRVHIGDTDVDRHYAVLAGLEFCHVDEVPPIGTPGWIL
jgi:hypothetical protein